MFFKKMYIVILLALVPMSNQVTLERLIGFPVFRSFRNFVNKQIGRTSENPGILQRARELNTLQDVVDENVSFPCPTEGFRSTTPPQTVHMVRPGDIDIVAAMGDSLTVGFGLVATNVVNFLVENRGLSWSSGGQGNWRNYLTLPNILKEYNPNLFGYALSDSLTVERNSQFNVAEAGAISSDMQYMSEILVKRIKNDPRVKINEHWKLITYMIGPNDFCIEMCFMENPESSIEKFRQTQIQVLRTLRDELPRTIVNLVPTPHLRVLRTTTEENKPNHCRALNRIECPCLFGFSYQKNLERFYKIMDQWQLVNKEVAEMPEFDKDDFTVIYQPFTVNASVPKLPNNLTDFSYMSQDCFHISQKFNAAVANSLWNNMMEPVNRKSTSVSPLFSKFMCPSERFPFIFTRHNSMDVF